MPGLHRDSWLTFDPTTTPALDETQEYELRFVGGLITGGCTPLLLPDILRSLDRPYCYRGDRIYYNWSARRWRLLPESQTDPLPILTTGSKPSSPTTTTPLSRQLRTVSPRPLTHAKRPR